VRKLEEKYEREGIVREREFEEGGRMKKKERKR